MSQFMLYILRPDATLEKNTNIIGHIEKYRSLIWNEQAYDMGEMELVIPGTSFIGDIGDVVMRTDKLVQDTTIDGANYNVEVFPMMITSITYRQTAEENQVIVKGKGLKAMFEYRVMTEKVVSEGTAREVLLGILKSARGTSSGIKYMSMLLAMPSNISTVSLKTTSEEDSKTSSGGTVANWLKDICEKNKWNWTVCVIRMEDAAKYAFRYDFGLYIWKGDNKTQSVVLSKESGNLLSSEWTRSIENRCNYAHIKGETYNGVTDSVDYLVDSNARGYYLYEKEVDLSSESMAPQIGIQTPNVTQYTDFLLEKGKEKIAKEEKAKFELTCETTDAGVYKIDKHYKLGDFVQIRTPDGKKVKAHITEIVRSYEGDGVRNVPKFSDFEEMN